MLVLIWDFSEWLDVSSALPPVGAWSFTMRSSVLWLSWWHFSLPSVESLPPINIDRWRDSCFSVAESCPALWPHQQYMNHEHPDVQAGFRKVRGTRDQIANICWNIKKAREFQKNIYCFIDYTKTFDCVDHNKLWRVLQEMEILDHLICLLRNLYAGQEAAVRTGHGTTECFQIGKGVHQGCILSHCLFNLYAEYIMRIAGLEEAQPGIKIAGRDINILWYADDTHPYGRKRRRTKEPLDESERRVKKLA